MKNHLLAIFLFGLASGCLQSQSDRLPKKALYLHTQVGFNAPALGDLNDVLQEGGYLKLSNIFLARGAGFYTIFPKLRLASLFTFSSFTGSRREADKSNWVRATSAGTTLGIAILNSRRVQLVPYGGIVYSWLGVRVASNTPNGTDFANYFSGPSNQHHISSNRFMANFGLHLAQTGLGNSNLGQKLMLGLRGGYYVPMGETKWKTSDVTLQDSPASSAGGPYLHLVFGLIQ